MIGDESLSRRPMRRGEPLPMENALALLERALKVLAEREHRPLLGLVKSTMLQLLGALDRPSGGELMFEGTDLGKLSERRLTILRRQRVGFELLDDAPEGRRVARDLRVVTFGL